MAYLLNALIGPRDTTLAAAKLLGSSVFDLEQGYALAPVDIRGAAPLRKSPRGDECLFVADAVQEAARLSSAGSTIAYVEADFFGGEGLQASMVWVDGRVDGEPQAMDLGYPGSDAPSTEWPINAALRAIGVQANDQIDEFGALQLSRLDRLRTT